MSEKQAVKRVEVTLLKPLVQGGDDVEKDAKIKVTPQQRVALIKSGHVEDKTGGNS